MAIYRGCYFSKDIQFKNRSTGQPTDITTWQFDASLKDETDTEVLAMSTGVGHFTVTDGENGWLRLALTQTETGNLSAGPVTGAVYRTDAVEGRKRIFRFSEQVREQD